MKVTIEFNDELNISEKELRHLMADAFYEFVSHRRLSAEEYVNKRYPDTEDYSWLDRKAKIAQVNRRILIATALHSAIWDIKVIDK